MDFSHNGFKTIFWSVWVKIHRILVVNRKILTDMVVKAICCWNLMMYTLNPIIWFKSWAKTQLEVSPFGYIFCDHIIYYFMKDWCVVSSNCSSFMVFLEVGRTSSNHVSNNFKFSTSHSCQVKITIICQHKPKTEWDVKYRWMVCTLLMLSAINSHNNI